ncbi:glycosyltransferase family 24 protein [Phanerochaete carnosa HHB-10118-sp]|uniref:Glycosyltransferase family 24 protein n=1 Tax=Phanerochaete carnosa (strain HHB-10118-sp) TaxID=650164 RepID=K5V494_PHACS|nr:glycosyltransferase family 24 protein [Phanerochaete carnosa HHB-10118-sp]EKM57416.1 glycosyltransferase family 24 protein [Phanerochaete carnosa HHB-10118-sp]
MRLRCLLALLPLTAVLASSPPVQVELRTSWAPPPFLVELLETIAIEDPESYFPLLDRFTHPEWSPLAQDQAHENVYRNALETALAAGYLAEPGELAAMEATFALHSSTPRLEAAYQFYSDNQAGRGADCGSWVDWYGDVVCSVEDLQRLAGIKAIEAGEVAARNGSASDVKVLPFDHIRPSPDLTLDRPPQTAVLYATLTSSNFRNLHSFLYAASAGPRPHIQYILRHIPPTGHASDRERAYLSGYGVALDLKKMDYLAMDDRRQSSADDSDASDDALSAPGEADVVAALLQQYPEDADTDYTIPLTSDELSNIGLQATQLIADASDPLATLKQLSQNFPKYASSIARRVVVSDTLEDEITLKNTRAPAGASMAWLNGSPLTEGDMNPLSLLRLLRKERAVMRQLAALGLNTTQSLDVLTHRAVGAAQADTGALDALFDASDRPEGGAAIVWCNDLEQDARYARWPDRLSTLRGVMLYPGQLPSLRLHLYNIALVLDLSQPAGLGFITNAVVSLISRGIPFRFGIVPSVETEESLKMARLTYWLFENIGQDKALNFIARLARLQLGNPFAEPTFDWSLVTSEFTDLLARTEGLSASLASIFDGEDEEMEHKVAAARAYAARLAADLTSAPRGHVFMNGKHFDLDDDIMRNMQFMGTQMFQHLQEQLLAGALTDDDAEHIATYFYDLPTTAARRNRYIYPSGKNSELVLNVPELLAKASFSSGQDAFVYPPGEAQVSLTTLIIADLDSEEGLALAKEALMAMEEDSPARVSFVHNPSNSTARASTSAFLGHLGEQVVLSAGGGIDEILDGASLAALDDDPFVRASRFLLRELKLAPGAQAVVVNGRVVGPFVPGGIVAEDLHALYMYEQHKRVGPVVEALEEVADLERLSRKGAAELIARAASLISSIHQPDPSEVGLFNAPVRPRKRSYQLLGGEHTKYEFGDNATAIFHVGILLDPISDTAQKWSALLEWLLNDPAVFVELHINPWRYTELPLKRFYRYNVQPALRFSDAGDETKSLVSFNGLPEDPIYTLAMDIPPSWFVRPREATYDLDNILLSGLGKHERAQGVYALFELDYLVIEGHAREDGTLTPPRGLQLQLINGEGNAIADTLVVANLGYLQFRAKPGVFGLEIRPGRGREIFELESAGSEGWNSPTADQAGNEITLMSFEGLTLYPRMRRSPGMELVDVLAPPRLDEQDGTIVDKLKHGITSLFKSKPEERTEAAEPATQQAEINIFTVASGLLYERFASIMILSVLRNTNSSVKFWFIENFLSPSFLEFIPHFAEAYNFQYELVTYKWPSWLRQQKEKQRIIWAYKILFLDVLFPMDLKKVIFVDADQIVRADLKELVDLNLHGAPYGYTPMGNDNEEMEGFRFWKTGYWKEHLEDLPYHISALYVVDLVRFRQLAAGDILRAHYQQLSADPNSLANLDQDLPNNLQREVPIFSLPEDWLWCETWCTKDRLHRAKTIDLCQNPLTKEPKLARAKHIPEWEEYDGEISRFARQLAENGLIHSGMADADATILADVGAGKVATENKQGTGSAGDDAETLHRQKDEL